VFQLFSKCHALQVGVRHRTFHPGLTLVHFFGLT
jgi:hypothetical protein